MGYSNVGTPIKVYLSPNQEGIALGAAHLVSSFFSCFPGSAALARRFVTG